MLTSFSEREQVWLNDGRFQPVIVGDANRDRQFDHQDIVLVMQAGKYGTGQPAT